MPVIHESPIPFGNLWDAFPQVHRAVKIARSLNITNTELVERSGLTHPTVGKIMRNEHSVNSRILAIFIATVDIIRGERVEESERA